MGKRNHRVNVNRATLFVIGLAGCAPVATQTYVGSLATEHGVCGPPNAPASLNLRGNSVQFAPNTGVVVLEGSIDAAGHVLTETQALGADHKPFAQVFEGQRDGDHITGRYATPRCRATVTLERR